MARLFLSYSREDRHLIEPLARLLELAGHGVWWDRRIAGGSDFSAEIARELGASDVVLVAWSTTSVTSHWVKDEAAEGRDAGRLVPLLLDRAMPPLGFRQIQAIDLSDWRGNTKPAAFDELLRAIDLIASSRDRSVAAAPVQRPPGVAIAPPATARRSRAGPVLIGAALLIGAAGATALLLQKSGGDDEVPPAAAAEPAATISAPAHASADETGGSPNIDGRWSLSWDLGGTPYRGVLVANGRTARIDLDADTSFGRQSVRQECSIAGSGSIRVTCHEVQVLSGPAGYMPDSFTLERVDSRTLRGELSDPLGLLSAPVTAVRQ